MVVFPNAKINLGLWVKEKRPDGYHEIETCFYPVQLCDILEITEVRPQMFSFVETGLVIDGPLKNNLVIRAWEMLARDFNLPPVYIHLHKLIPMGAGLGGGSSNAAFALILINKLLGLGLNPKLLHGYASVLGSDCAFFLINKPCIATGRGEHLDPVSLNLAGYHILLVKPEIKINTAWAYANITPAQRTVRLKDVIMHPVEDWKQYLVNDFEEVVFGHYPTIGKLKEQLYESGAVYASMTGSGSAVYGLFRNAPPIQNFICDHFTWVGRLM